MDDHDPTLNNPALDLEDSDDDAEWNPLKDADKTGKRKRGGDSSDEEDYSEFNNIHQLNKNKNKRRAYQQGHSSQSIQNRKSTADTPEVPEEEDFKVSIEFSFTNIKHQLPTACVAGWNVPRPEDGGEFCPTLPVESGRPDSDPEVRVL